MEHEKSKNTIVQFILLSWIKIQLHQLTSNAIQPRNTPSLNFNFQQTTERLSLKASNDMQPAHQTIMDADYRKHQPVSTYKLRPQLRLQRNKNNATNDTKNNLMMII